VPEGQRLDFKQTVDISSTPDKRELLKDLTAMGNGGGGTLAFGIAERKDGELSFADTVTPLTDRSLVRRAANLVLSTVRPTLLWRSSTIEVKGGYVLVVDVDPSPLGPYMVQYKGDYRYYRRVGEDSVPMDESMVRDLYAGAAAWTRQRELEWSDTKLPFSPNWSGEAFLTVSGIPIPGSQDIFDPSTVEIEDLTSDAVMLWDSHHARLAGTARLMSAMSVWADGFTARTDGDVPQRDKLPTADQVRIRLHRSGAIGVGAHIGTGDELDPVRMANAYLAYLGRLWLLREVRTIEVRIELTQFSRYAGPTPARYPAAEHPDEAPAIAAAIGAILSVEDLTDTASRHRRLREFADRIANAFGRRSAEVGWDRGLLRTRERDIRLVASEGTLLDLNNGGGEWFVASNGSVRRPSSLEARVAWWRQGALLDLEGNLLATTEFPTCDGLPTDFAVAHPSTPIADHMTGRQPEETSEAGGAALYPAEAPACTGVWSDQDPLRYMRNQI
jgi:hypothetical protein